MADRLRHVNLGAPPVPWVPQSHFIKFDERIIEMAWQIVGPSVAENLGRMRPLPLWTIFAACYAEGLHHGAEMMREKLT